MKLKVSKSSNPSSVAGAIVGVLNEEEQVDIIVVGAAALNQAIKSVAIARGFTAPSGIDLYIYPSFSTVEIKGETTTGILLKIKKEVR